MTAPITYSGPTISTEVPWETRRHLQLIYQKLGNHTQAFGLIQQSVSKVTASTTTNTGSGGSSGATTAASAALTAQVSAAVASALVSLNVPTGIAVNDQAGVTSYSTIAGDNNALIVFSDASPVACTVNQETPPFACFIANIGAGTVTVTPSTGTISYAGTSGGTSMPLTSGESALVAFDGTNWWAMLIATGGGGSGVTSLNALTGALTISPGTGITVTPSGSTITIAATGGGSGVSSIQGETGAVTLQSTGATVAITTPSSSTINLEAVSSTNNSGTSPTVTLHGAAGSGATYAVTGNDSYGTIQITAGSGASAGLVATVNLATAFSAHSVALVQGFVDATAVATNFVAYPGTGSSWDLTTTVAMTSSTVYTIRYVCFGN